MYMLRHLLCGDRQTVKKVVAIGQFLANLTSHQPWMIVTTFHKNNMKEKNKKKNLSEVLVEEPLNVEDQSYPTFN